MCACVCVVSLQVCACRNVATAAVNKHEPTSSSRFSRPIGSFRQKNPVPRNTPSVAVSWFPGLTKFKVNICSIWHSRQVETVRWSLQQKVLVSVSEVFVIKHNLIEPGAGKQTIIYRYQRAVVDAL